MNKKDETLLREALLRWENALEHEEWKAARAAYYEVVNKLMNELGEK